MMKEQKETIERLNRFKSIKVLYGNTFAMTTEQLKILQEDIETAINILKEKDKEIEKKDKRINDLEYALLDMVMQFADRPNIKGSRYALNTMGLSALELAFDVLGFDDPYPVNKAEEKYKILAKQYFETKVEEER